MNINSHKNTYRAYALVITLASLALASLAFAQEGTQNQEMHESRRVQVSEQVQNRITNLGDNIDKRVRAALVRLGNISERIESRIGKLKTLEVDTSVAESRFAEAKSALAQARTDIDSLGTVANVMSSDSPKDAFSTIRTQFIAIQSSLREARLGFIDTVNLLKEAVAQAELTRGVSSAVTDTVSPENDTEEAE